MTDLLVAALRRDRVVILGALLGTSALAWALILMTSGDLPGAMSGGQPGALSGMTKGDHHAHGGAVLAELLAGLAMWILMMVAMMMPSAAPMVLLYARVGAQARGRGLPFAAPAWFAGGYLAAWTGFAVAATIAQAGLAHLNAGSLLHPWGGALLIVAGVYELTPWKRACLVLCRNPLSFIQDHGGFRGDKRGALRLGMRHGLYCIGCCWALMAIMLVGGAMNLLLMATLMIVVLAEKLTSGPWVPRAVGAALIAAGAWTLLR